MCHTISATGSPTLLFIQSSALNKSNPTMENQKLVQVSDQEVCIDFVLGSKCRATVRLRSLSTTAPIAFKVQTSSPQKFLVNPPSGLIPPLSQSTFQLILKPQAQIPATFPRSPSDRFLIKTQLAPDLTHLPIESTHPEFINSWFNSNHDHVSTHDIKLKVAFVGPFLLRHAVKMGDTEAVKNIVKRKRTSLTELTSREAESLLRVATELDNSDAMVDLLIESGLKFDAGAAARVKKSDELGESKGWSELHVAIALDRTDDVLRLVNVGQGQGQRGTLDCRDKEGRTALHLAAGKGNERYVRMLAGAGADVDAKRNDGRTALYRAAANGERSMVKVLIELGADPTMIVPADRGRSALDIARQKGHEEVVEILERGIEVLNTARRGDLIQLESLLEKEASVNYRDQYGLTPIHAAAIKGNKDAVMLLVEFGSDVECQDNEGHMPLHLAAVGGCRDTVEVLLNRGANVNVKNKKGATPLQMAREMGYGEIMQLLIDRGADHAKHVC